ncbi:MAG TPA: two-component sensor histidine kinase [Desulfobacteraceae bacterium]|nr:two-component sensor histidine kinase [Desulfobacteraceae bacterium]
MKRPGIHIRLLAAAMLLIGATTLSLGYAGTLIIHEFVKTRFEERISFLARYLALNAELGILIDEKEMLKRLSQNLLSEKDVIGVSIFGTADEPLAEVIKPFSGVLSVIESPVILKESQDESRAFQWNPPSSVIGKVKIMYTTEGLVILLDTMKRRFVWLSGIAGLFSVLIFYFISRSLVAPITELVQTSRKVAAGNLQLRADLGVLPETRELAAAFNAMLDSLENSRKALEKANLAVIRQTTLAELGKFSLMIAHEVKNPLGIIKSSMDILKKDIPEGDMMVEFIEDEIRRLNRLIEDFLLFARPANPAFRPVNLHEMLKHCAERFELQTADIPVTIETDIPEDNYEGLADPDLLVRAIGNIIKNAMESGGEDENVIRIRAFFEKDFWIAEISDQGPGIDPEYIDKIFEPFFTTRSKGTGLGLAFAFQVIKAHGGMITAQNSPEGGAVFQIKIPKNDA